MVGLGVRTTGEVLVQGDHGQPTRHQRAHLLQTLAGGDDVLVVDLFIERRLRRQSRVPSPVVAPLCLVFRFFPFLLVRVVPVQYLVQSCASVRVLAKGRWIMCVGVPVGLPSIIFFNRDGTVTYMYLIASSRGLPPV